MHHQALSTTLGGAPPSCSMLLVRPNPVVSHTLLPISGALPHLPLCLRRNRTNSSNLQSTSASRLTRRLQSVVAAKASTSGSLEAGDGGSGGIGRGHGHGHGHGNGGGDGNGHGDGHLHGDGDGDGAAGRAGILAAFLRGWSQRVRADPQFGFKVFSEVVIGVGACVIGDMASRPNFGLDELDFVFSTIVVGSILNFTLMYMLAPTAAAGQLAKRLPSVFASCPPGHMFEAGRYSVLDRAGTFVYKGVQFAVVGFGAGLVGTALSNLLLTMRKKVDPSFVTQNQSPPTVLNALTWAAHMGLSSNARYQTLNGLEFTLAGVLHPNAFKAAVFFMRGLNNVLGGMTFVMLARKTGSQSSAAPKAIVSAAEPEQVPLLTEQSN
jgi:hypothetical protein